MHGLRGQTVLGLRGEQGQILCAHRLHAPFLDQVRSMFRVHVILLPTSWALLLAADRPPFRNRSIFQSIFRLKGKSFGFEPDRTVERTITCWKSSTETRANLQTCRAIRARKHTCWSAKEETKRSLHVQKKVQRHVWLGGGEGQGPDLEKRSTRWLVQQANVYFWLRKESSIDQESAAIVRRGERRGF